MTFCPLCGRKYVKESQVVRPPSKEEVLAQWRARKRAARAGVDVPQPVAIAAVAPGFPVIAPRLLTTGAAAMFVSAFALGESVALNLLR